MEQEKKEAAQPVTAPPTNPPSGPGLDFFHSDPFIDGRMCTQNKNQKNHDNTMLIIIVIITFIVLVISALQVNVYKTPFCR